MKNIAKVAKLLGCFSVFSAFGFLAIGVLADSGSGIFTTKETIVISVSQIVLACFMTYSAELFIQKKSRGKILFPVSVFALIVFGFMSYQYGFS